MRTGRNRPGISTDFIDNQSQEILLRIGCSATGEPLVAFRLYDCSGSLVAQTDDFTSFPTGISVVAPDGSVLLEVPEPPLDQIAYRLYNREGHLLTCSDGQRTQVYAFLRMEKGKI
ncbi:MAG TPA: hypothetical protein VH951_02085 [Dehalococcoidia bacterium]|jgi:hypothetical protein